MARIPTAVIAACACMMLAGCEDLSPGVAPLDSAEVDSVDEPAISASEPAFSEPAISASEPEFGEPVSSSDPALSAASGASRGPNRRVRLRTGIALAQTLPSGTCMTFSATYAFAGVGPDSDCGYFWVIKPNRGRAVRQSVQLAHSGTLQSVAPSLRPDNGPFTCHILEKSPQGSERSISGDFELR